MSVAGEIVIELKLDDRDMSVNVKNAGGTLRQFKSTLDSTANSVKRLEEAQLSLSTKFRNLVLTLGNLRFVAMDINDIFLRLPVAILKSAGELERMEVLMRGLSRELTAVGRAAEGVRDFNFVTQLAKTAPFEISALSDSFVKLKTAGIDPTNGSMQALVDSVARFGGNGESLKRASIAIQQMAGKGVISMEELRQQLGEAVPTAMQDMATGMRMSMAELAKVVATGTLQAEVPLKKMLLQMRINNEGAAAQMMETWSGMLSRLKSEWELTAKFIADSGFGKEAKAAVAELTNLLQSDDFRKFAAEMGNGLGEAVRAISDVVKWIIKYREEIGTLIQMWVAYKVVFSGIVPLTRSLSEAYNVGSDAFRRYRDAAVNGANDYRASVVSAIDADRQRLQTATRASADLIINKRAESAALAAENTKIAAQYAKLDAALTSAQVRNRDVRFGGMIMSQKEASQSLRQLDAALDANAARIKANAVEVMANQQAIATGRAEVARKTAEIAKMTNGWNLSAVAAAGAAGATKVFSAAVAFMGGPIGVAITAITALIFWWESAADAAEKSADRQRRAMQGFSDIKDMNAAKAELLKAETALFSVQQMSTPGSTLENSQEYANMLEQAQKLVLEKRANLAQIEKAFNEGEINRRVSELNFEADVNARKIEEAGIIRMNAIKAAADKAIEAVKGNAAREKAERDKQATIQEQDLVKRINEQIEGEARAIADATKKSEALQEGAERSALLKFVAARRAKKEALERSIAELKRTIDAVPQYNSKDQSSKDFKASQSIIERLIGDVNEKRAQLDAELRSFDTTLRAADKTAGLIAEIEQKFQNGDFKYGPKKEKDATREQVQRLQQGQVDLAYQERMAEERKRLGDKIREMMPGYQDALEMLANPLDTAKKGAAEAQLDKFLSKLNSGDVETALSSMGRTLAEVRGMAQTIDVADFFAKMEQQTRDINASIVDDSRESAKARAQAETEAFRKQSQNYIDMRKVAGASFDEIDQLQAKLAANMEARTRDMAIKFRTPLEAMVAQWKNVGRNIDEATARWADSFVETTAVMLETGKFQFREFTTSVLKDLLRITLRDAMGDGVKNVFGAASEYLKGAFAAINKPAGDTAAANAVAASQDLLKDSAKQAGTALSTMTANGVNATTNALGQSIAATTQETLAKGSLSAITSTVNGSLAALAAAAQQAAGALASMAASGGGSNAMGYFAKMFGGGGSTTGYGTNFGSQQTAMLMEQDSWFFANGGIMTALGSMPLKKYAAGGIANSPQVAIYGEGKTPEAYVPLPDGRTIPVTMTGAGGAGQMVSISITVNQDGSEKSGAQGDESGTWTRIANRVKSVVREELVTQQRPGGILAR